MEVNEFTPASGKYNTAGNWSLAHKPKANEQAVIPAGRTCEVSAAGEAGSLKVRGRLSGNAELKVGGAEAGPSNALCDFIGAEGITWTGALVFVGTFTTTAQTVATGGFSIGSFRVGGAATGKAKLIEALTATASSTGVLGEGGSNKGSLEFNGQTVTAKNVEFREGAVADFTNAVFHLGGEGGVFMLNSIGTTFTGLASATVEVTDRSSGELSPAKQVNGGNKEIGTIIDAGFNVTLESVTWKELRIENSGCAAGKGCKLKSGGSFTDAVITANGSEGAPARLESSTSGVAATLTMPEQELVAGFLAIKDLTIASGPWYVPPAHGKNEGGNTVVATTIIFGSKVGAGALKGRMTATSTMSGKLQAPGVAKGAVAGAATAKAGGQAPGVARGLVAGAGALTGRAQSPGAATGRVAGVAGLSARAQAAGGAAGRLAGVGTLAGRLQSPGVLRGALGGASALLGRASAAGTLRAVLAGAATLAGKANANGQLVGRLSGAGGFVGRFAAAGRLAGRIVGISTAAGGAQAPGVPEGAVRGASTFAGRLHARGVLAGRSVAASSLRGRLAGSAGLRGRISAVSGWLIHVSLPSTKRPVDVELDIFPLVSSNLRVWPRVASDVELRATVASRISITKGGSPWDS